MKLAIACLACVAVLVAVQAKKTAKRAPTPPPAITAAMRAAAAGKVDRYLDSTAGGAWSHAKELTPALAQLYELRSGATAPPFHIVHFGDSHTAADEWTGGLRDRFQERFGDGGSGFSLAGNPFPGYRRFDARGGATTGWAPGGLRSAAGDGYFGLGGVSISTAHAGQSVFLDAECDSLEIHFLMQPGGGTLALYQDGQWLDDIPTEGETGPGDAAFRPAPGTHRFTLKTLSARPVRLFGWVADKPSGVTYEALGINGAEAAVMLRWNEEMVATYLHRRNPGLVVLAYGTNEASDPNWNSESYQAMFSKLLDRIHAAAPAAPVLVIGPGDRWSRTQTGWRVLPGIDRVMAAQQQACRTAGCVYWDTRERMGGKGAMRDWVYAGLAQPDYVHFTAAGYRRLAEALFGDLMARYSTYEKARLENQEALSHGRAQQDH